ncbi:hypothetical protein B0H19DRAFT_1259963 [Mycena capillaripes]|nr:hypothetical protein B0H19DRAFT_1259963 [Mycena capillaripes]
MRPLTVDSLNPELLTVHLPFDKYISSNIGNPQQKGLGHPAITITRLVAALTEWDLAPGVFPADVVARAKELFVEIGSIGAYSHSQGVPFIRRRGQNSW